MSTSTKTIGLLSALVVGACFAQIAAAGQGFGMGSNNLDNRGYYFPRPETPLPTRPLYQAPSMHERDFDDDRNNGNRDYQEQRFFGGDPGYDQRHSRRYPPGEHSSNQGYNRGNGYGAPSFGSGYAPPRGYNAPYYYQRY